jgi:hypothetical protein
LRALCSVLYGPPVQKKNKMKTFDGKWIKPKYFYSFGFLVRISAFFAGLFLTFGLTAFIGIIDLHDGVALSPNTN